MDDIQMISVLLDFQRPEVIDLSLIRCGGVDRSKLSCSARTSHTQLTSTVTILLGRINPTSLVDGPTRNVSSVRGNETVS